MNQQNPSPSGAVQLFDQGAGALAQQQQDAAAVARSIQEIQAALVIAQRNPRDEVRVRTKVLESCKRIELAEVSEYEYSRGGTRITGPTIDLLRMVANRWGNVRHGWAETERINGVSSVRAFAWDMQTNAQAERTWKVRHWRDTQGGGYELKDERDIYELIANSAARRVRACLEEVIDSDIVNLAIDECRKTLKAGQSGKSNADIAVELLDHFKQFAVTQEMIEARLGNKLEAISPNQVSSLRRVFKSLRDGVGTREEFFKPVMQSPNFDQPPGATAPPAPQAPPPAQAPQAPVTPQAPPPATAPAAPAAPATPSQPSDEELKRSTLDAQGRNTGFNPLKGVRGLCQMDKIKEGELLSYWAHTGVTDGSQTSLEEVMMTKPEILKTTAEQWPTISPKIKEFRKSGNPS